MRWPVPGCTRARGGPVSRTSEPPPEGSVSEPVWSAATRRAAPRRRAADKPTFCLILLHPMGPDLGRRFDLPEKKKAVIGRDPAADIQLARDRVSRRHARLEQRGE